MSPQNIGAASHPEINYTRLSDGELIAARGRVEQDSSSPGLWLSEAVGGFAAADTIDIMAMRSQILSNAESEIAHTNRVLELINNGRPKKSKLRISPAGEWRERLEDQITTMALGAARQGHVRHSVGKPLIPVPPLPSPITAEELVSAISRSSIKGTVSPNSLQFIKQFSVDKLTGYDEKRAESGAMVLLETGFDESRAGNVHDQLVRLQGVQGWYPEVGSAPIVATAVLGQRYNLSPVSRKDTLTRAIEVAPGYLSRIVSRAVVEALIDTDGEARIFGSKANGREGLTNTDPHRRQIQLDA